MGWVLQRIECCCRDYSVMVDTTNATCSRPPVFVVPRTRTFSRHYNVFGTECARLLPNPDQVVDARDQACPLPVLKAKKALGALPAGGHLLVMATDPGATEDLRILCALLGAQVLSVGTENGVCKILIRKNVVA